jgi:alpha-L-rhamnosidase
VTVSVSLRAEYRQDSSWVASVRPRLSWIATTDESRWVQTAAELTLDGGAPVVLTGPENILVDWPFDDLRPREAVVVRVRLRDGDGTWSDPSEPLCIRLGALPEGEWQGTFVGLAAPEAPAQPFVARTRIEITAPLRCATFYWSALGVATAMIDGRPVDDAVLSPGWTTYPDRILHETVDVTDALGPGSRVLGLEVTGGWFTESYGFGEEAKRVYGDQPWVAAQLHLLYADGTERVITTGDGWEAAAAGSVVASGLYAGETIDHRRSLDWWLPEAEWSPVERGPMQPVPSARFSEPARRVAELEVREVVTTPSGRTVLDFGQNLVGRLRVNVEGPAGTRIVVRHAEVLEDGELATRPLRRAAATDTFVLAGAGLEEFEPSGTFHGFRYAEITGWPGTLDPSQVRAVVVQSDMRRTGVFSTSHEQLQRLHENVVWSMRGNFLTLPTDCPQRDERLGWTGDAQIFAPAATSLFDCNGFFANWLTDLRLDQARSGGIVPTVVPNVLGFAWPAAGWGDAATVIPSVLNERYADAGLLADSIDSMRAWVEVELDAAGDAGLWENSLQFGDWLDPAAPADMAGAAKTYPGIVATAYLCRSLDLLADAADRSGDAVTAAWASERVELVRRAFRSAYVTPEGRMLSDASTAYALALQFRIVTEPEMRERLAARLAHAVARDAFHISTGFIGTPLVLDALIDFGYEQEASALLLQTRAPSWLYPVTMGATTVWERWDSMLPDGAINPGEMTSFNHYALGAVIDWFYRRLAGIAPLRPGYSLVRFAPVALRGMQDAAAELATPSGVFRGGWARVDGAVVWSLAVPAHARAIVELPGGEPIEVGPGRHTWTTEEAAQPASLEVSVWSPVAEIAARSGAYAAVMKRLDAHDPGLAENVRKRTDWTLNVPLAVALFSVPPAVTAEIATSLEALSSA